MLLVITHRAASYVFRQNVGSRETVGGLSVREVELEILIRLEDGVSLLEVEVDLGAEAKVVHGEQSVGGVREEIHNFSLDDVQLNKVPLYLEDSQIQILRIVVDVALARAGDVDRG